MPLAKGADGQQSDNQDQLVSLSETWEDASAAGCSSRPLENRVKMQVEFLALLFANLAYR